jgi:tetratricopeptide (TPR) repeat protein
LSLLDGLPLALAQAAAYLHESGLDFSSYIRYYNRQWKDLMESQDRSGFPLLDYPERSVLTTWTISFNAIKAKNEAATNLLLLWAFLDNKDLWHGLLHAAAVSMEHWPEWLQLMAANELRFVEAVKLLQSYSMIERLEDLKSYTTHLVVHRWASYMQDDDQRKGFMQLAVMVVGLSVPTDTTNENWILQRRLLPHANSCSHWILTELKLFYDRERHFDEESTEEVKNMGMVLDATHCLGYLYADQGKLKEAEEMYQQALAGNEKALGLDHTSTLVMVNNLGVLYTDQDKLAEAEAMHLRALAVFEKALGPDHTLTLATVGNLGILYKKQDRLVEAEAMYQRALVGNEKALGLDHASTLVMVNNLGVLYTDQDKLAEAEAMHQRALVVNEKTLGPDHTSTLRTISNLGNLYYNQGKLAEAEAMYQRALAGREKALGLDHTSTLETVNSLGALFAGQGKLAEAEAMYQRVLAGREKALGRDHTSTLSTVNNLGALYKSQGKLAEAEAMYQRALAGREKALGLDHPLTLATANNLGQASGSGDDVPVA